MDLLGAVVDVLRERPGVRAKIVASQLGLTKGQVNSVLYAHLDVFQQDSNYGWTLRNAAPIVNWQIPSLFPWQQKALTTWFQAGSTGIIEAVTGTGKTILGIEAALQMAAKGGRTTVIVPSVALQRQWVEKFKQFAPHLKTTRLGGGAQGVHRKADVLVAVQNSAANHNLIVDNRPHLLVADEVHRYGSKTGKKAIDGNYDWQIGLTATLERSGDDEVDEFLLPHFGGKIFSYDYKQAVPEKVVAPFKLVFLGAPLTESEREEYDRLCEEIKAIKKKIPLWVFVGKPGQQEANLKRCMEEAQEKEDYALLNACRKYDSLRNQRRQLLWRVKSKPGCLDTVAPIIGNSRGSIVFTEEKDAAENAAAILRARGIPANATYSGMNDNVRNRHLVELQSGVVKALCAPRILDEGVDVPNVDVGVVLSATRQRRQMIQRLGRVIRKKDDGRHAKFMVVYAEGTLEDPNERGHEEFNDMVSEVAERVTILRPGWKLPAVAAALA